MKERLITGIALLVIVFYFLLYSSELLFVIGVLIVTFISAYEWISLSKIYRKAMFSYLIVFMIITFIVTEFFVYLQYIFPIFWLYAIFNLIQYERKKIDTFSSIKIIIFGLFVITPFTSCLYILHSNNVKWIFMFIFIIAATDSGAYFIGNIIGKHKMLPRVSPNKTIEGLIGGIFCAIVVAVIFLLYMDLSPSEYVYMVLISILISVLSVVGDVFESMMKRIAGVKDSGNILPGHGGVLDRLDGYMPTLPVFVLLGYYAGLFTL